MFVSFPRVGLLGNPGDLFGGETLALTFTDFQASVRIAGPSPNDPVAKPLLDAARTVFGQAFGVSAFGNTKFTLVAQSDIPRQVGLAGSSALITAALQALSAQFGVPLNAGLLAQLALRAETEEMGITAGPMDRVAQAYGGLTWAQLGGPPPFGPDVVQHLDTELLPPLFVAWDPTPGQASGAAHNDVAQRWQAGDPKIRQAITELSTLAQTGVDALRGADHEGFRRCVDRNFDIRDAHWPLRSRDRELVTLGRTMGAAVKYAGSGGAVVGVMVSADRYPELEQAYGAAGFQILRPSVHVPRN